VGVCIPPHSLPPFCPGCPIPCNATCSGLFSCLYLWSCSLPHPYCTLLDWMGSMPGQHSLASCLPSTSSYQNSIGPHCAGVGLFSHGSPEPSLPSLALLLSRALAFPALKRSAANIRTFSHCPYLHPLFYTHYPCGTSFRRTTRHLIQRSDLYYTAHTRFLAATTCLPYLAGCSLPGCGTASI